MKRLGRRLASILSILEVNAAEPDEFIRKVKALKPTFGGANLEDIKAPDCFYIEEQLSRKLFDIRKRKGWSMPETRHQHSGDFAPGARLCGHQHPLAPTSFFYRASVL